MAASSSFESEKKENKNNEENIKELSDSAENSLKFIPNAHGLLYPIKPSIKKF